MLRITLVAGAFACALAMPASAQNTMSGPAPAPAAMKASDSGMTCGQMMSKEQSMSMHASGARMSMAQNHMHMASVAKGKGDEAGCKMHVQKAMDAMK